MFKVDVTICPRCYGEMKITSFVTEPDEATRYLALGPRAPPLAHQPFELCEGPQLALHFA